MGTLCFQICRHASTLQSVNESLAARGYLRPHKPYSPSENVKERLSEIFAGSDSQLSNGRTKFKILSACFKEFGHSVPNSKLHEINTKGCECKICDYVIVHTNNFLTICR